MSPPKDTEILPQNMPTTVKVLEIDPAKVALFRQRLKEEQNLSRAVLAGGAAALFGAILWAFVAFATGYNTAIMAIVVGACVGYSVRKFGKGVEDRFGLLGAAFSIFGCLLGHFLAIAAFISRQDNVSLLRVFLVMLLQPLATLAIIASGFGIVDIVF
jgi:hypothetical protein